MIRFFTNGSSSALLGFTKTVQSLKKQNIKFFCFFLIITTFLNAKSLKLLYYIKQKR